MLPFAELSWPLTVLLLSLRVGALILLTPVFSLVGLPVPVRILFVLALATCLVSGLNLTPSPATLGSPANLALAAAGELAIGSVLAFGLFAAFAAFQFAGRILDVQLGFGVAGLIDPTTKTSAPLLGTVLNLAGVLTFFLIDGHHWLLRGIAFSLVQYPPGAVLHAPPVGVIVAQFGGMFVGAAVLASPVMVVVLLVDLAMAMVSRTMPQMNVFIIGLPLKIFVGLVVLALTLEFLAPVYSRVFSELFASWQKILT
jgi:flagellar biosynthesis protein FliR